MSSKPEDIGPVCVNFEKYGRCQYGISCRYGKSHISEDFQNIINEDLYKEMSDRKVVRNVLSKEIQHKLWKKKYNFDKANANTSRIRKEFQANYESTKTQNSSGHTDGSEAKCDTSHSLASVSAAGDAAVTTANGTRQSDKAVCLTDSEGICLRPQEKKLVSTGERLGFHNQRPV